MMLSYLAIPDLHLLRQVSHFFVPLVKNIVRNPQRLAATLLNVLLGRFPEVLRPVLAEMLQDGHFVASGSMLLRDLTQASWKSNDLDLFTSLDDNNVALIKKFMTVVAESKISTAVVVYHSIDTYEGAVPDRMGDDEPLLPLDDDPAPRSRLGELIRHAALSHLFVNEWEEQYAKVCVAPLSRWFDFPYVYVAPTHGCVQVCHGP
jgi:hypothetical protein